MVQLLFQTNPNRGNKDRTMLLLGEYKYVEDELGSQDTLDVLELIVQAKHRLRE